MSILNSISIAVVCISINSFGKSIAKEDLCKREWWEKATPSMLIQSLEDRKIETLYCRGKNDTLIFNAAPYGQPQTVKVFLEKGGKNLLNTSYHGWTPIRMAIQYQTDNNVIQIVRLLISHGVTLNFTPFGSVVDSRLPPRGGHSVWYEVLSGHSRRKLSIRMKIAEVLLESGANTRIPSPGNGTTSIGLAAREAPWPLVEKMIQFTPQFKWSEICGLKNKYSTKLNTCAYYAMENSDQRVVDQALAGIQKEGFTVKTFPKNSKGNTLLHNAILFGTVITMKKLIRLGADKTAKNNQGWTPARTLKWRIQGGTSAISDDEEILQMMDIPIPWTLKLKKFF